MGNAHELQTPKGLFATRDVGAHMSYYIANYKGGRNESFMYGVDEHTEWFDYDLVSAYTTGMSHMSLPDYFRAGLLNESNVNKMNEKQLLNGYLIINAKFNFPDSVKYPSIPCYIDKTTTVYPLKGEAFITGPEFILARSQGCKFFIKSAFYIHPKGNYNPITKTIELMKPFNGIINKLQKLRREFPKGTLNNMMYKELGNGIYGNIVKGISNKQEFDATTKQMSRVNASELSNPILASWITAFIRSVIGECINNVQLLGGKVVSVTTDGFITDIKNLESKILKLPKHNNTLLRLYRKLRIELTTKNDPVTKQPNLTTADPRGLELKTFGKGVLS
jgi:hypothetical protein